MKLHRTPRVARGIVVVLAALALGVAVVAGPASALTLDYTLVPAQSAVDLVVDVDFMGGALTASEQFAGSLTTRYDGSLRADTIGQSAIAFPSGGAAVARNQILFGSVLRPISPGVGGASGSAAGNYGVTLAAAVGIELPPIEIPDLGTLNLGTLQSVDVDVALRDVVFDAVTGVHLPVTGGAFDASQVDVLLTGFADVNLAAVLRAPDLLSYFANLVVLNALVASFPDLGLGVTGNALTRDISIGLGTRLSFDALALANQAEAGSFTRVGDDYVLELPLLAALAPEVIPGVLDLQIGLSGQLRGVAPVPEPTTVVLFGIGLAALAGRSRRRV